MVPSWRLACGLLVVLLGQATSGFVSAALPERLPRQEPGNGTSDTSSDTRSGGLAANWYWLLVAIVTILVLSLLGGVCCLYHRQHCWGSGVTRSGGAVKTNPVGSPVLTGYNSPLSEPSNGSPDHGFVLSPPTHSLSSRHSLYSNGKLRRNHSPGNSSGSEDTIQHGTATPSVTSLASMSSVCGTGKSEGTSFSRRRSNSHTRVYALSADSSSLSVNSAASTSSVRSTGSSQSNKNYQSDSSQQTVIEVDVHLHGNEGLSQQETTRLAYAAFTESLAKLAQELHDFDDEVVKPYQVQRLYSHQISPPGRGSPLRSITRIHYSSPEAGYSPDYVPEMSLDREQSYSRQVPLSSDEEDAMFNPSSLPNNRHKNGYHSQPSYRSADPRRRKRFSFHGQDCSQVANLHKGGVSADHLFTFGDAVSESHDAISGSHNAASQSHDNTRSCDPREHLSLQLTPLSSSVSSSVNDLSQLCGTVEFTGLQRQHSEPNISLLSRGYSGTSLSASGYAPSGASTVTLDSDGHTSYEGRLQPCRETSHQEDLLLSNPNGITVDRALSSDSLAQHRERTNRHTATSMTGLAASAEV